MIGLALVSTIGVLAASLNASVDDLVDEEFTSDFLVQSTNFLPFSTAVGDDLAEVDGVAVVSRQQWTRRPGRRRDGLPDRQRRGVQRHLRPRRSSTGSARPGGPAGRRDRRASPRTTSSRSASPLTATFLAGEGLDLEVAGIDRADRDHGDVSVPIDLLAEAGVPRQDTSLSIVLEPGADAEAVGAALDEAAATTPIVAVYDKQEFAESIRDQVNQLLYIIYGLLALAIVIAVIGIVNTLGLSRHRAHPRDRPAPRDRHEPGPAAADDHPGVGRDRRARRGARHGARPAHRRAAAPGRSPRT